MTTRRVPVAAEPLVPSGYDYADSFELRLDAADDHSAEDWVRTGLERAAPPVRGLIRLVHRHVVRFRLTDAPGNVLGWRVVASAHDVVHLRTGGSLMQADIVARRSAEDVVGFTTFLHYESRGAPLLWAVVGPLHRLIAPYLLRRAGQLLAPIGAARR